MKFKFKDICYMPIDTIGDGDFHECMFLEYIEDCAIFYLFRIDSIVEWRAVNFDRWHEKYV